MCISLIHPHLEHQPSVGVIKKQANLFFSGQDLFDIDDFIEGEGNDSGSKYSAWALLVSDLFEFLLK